MASLIIVPTRIELKMKWTDSEISRMVDALAKNEVVRCPVCGADVLTASVSASTSLGVKYIFDCSSNCGREDVADVTHDPRFAHLK